DDKYGRRYTWLVFEDHGKEQNYFIQVWLERHAKSYATSDTHEHYFAKHGYFFKPKGVVIFPFSVKQQKAVQKLQRLQNQIFILVLTYAPFSCAHRINSEQPKYVLEEQCNVASNIWNIHGLWAEGSQAEVIDQHRQACKNNEVARPLNQRVTSEADVGEFHQQNSLLTTTGFHNNTVYWDYQYCAHGYFLVDSKNKQRFPTAKDYFNRIRTLYENLQLDEKVREAGLIPSDTKLYNLSQFDTGVLGKYGVYVARKIIRSTGMIAGIVSVNFCYGLNFKLVNCKDKFFKDGVGSVDYIGTQITSDSLPYLVMPKKYSFFQYIVLQLKWLPKSKSLLVLELRPSSFNRFLRKRYFDRRQQHEDELNAQLQYDDRILGFVSGNEKSWAYNSKHTLLEWYHPRIKYALLLMAEMKNVATMYDYFRLGRHLYDKLEMRGWLDATRNSEVVKDDDIYDRIEAYMGGELQEVILTCKNDMLSHILVCFSKDDLRWIPCTETEVPGKGLDYNYQRCGKSFNI
ncbi:hypothetical protein B4U80_11898, partial [Leptotrombidium deliense]